MSEVADEFQLDLVRSERIGLSEAIYCAGKTPAQIAGILAHARAHGSDLLLTRLDEQAFAALPESDRAGLDYDALSATAVWGRCLPVASSGRIAVVTAGTSDVPMAREAARTLRFEGHVATEVFDVGVAGIWRLMRRVEALRQCDVVIVAAGMDAALPSVVGGLVPGLVIAIPTSVGYGVAAGGKAALGAVLASCAPGIVVVNIDNGYGAACAAIRAIGPSLRRAEHGKT